MKMPSLPAAACAHELLAQLGLSAVLQGARLSFTSSLVSMHPGACTYGRQSLRHRFPQVLFPMCIPTLISILAPPTLEAEFEGDVAIDVMDSPSQLVVKAS
jgi:hypothetical protein